MSHAIPERRFVVSKKGRKKLLFGLKVLAICGAAVFTIKGVSNFYADAQKEVESREETDRIQDVIESATPAPDAVATTEPTKTRESKATKRSHETSRPKKHKGLIESMDWDADEEYMLAKIAMAEAEDEGVKGKALVILVVLNRVWSDGFPDSIEEVIFEKGQFSPISNGRYDRVEPDEECFEALDLITVKKWDKSQGALYFESNGASNWHRNNLLFLFQYGNHYFYKEKE